MVEKIIPLLEKKGYRLISVPDGETAFKVMEDEPVKFIMYDVESALRGGARPFLDLKAKYPHLPVVAVTPIRKPGMAVPEHLRRKTRYDAPPGDES